MRDAAEGETRPAKGAGWKWVYDTLRNEILALAPGDLLDETSSTAWAFEPSAMFPTSAVARAGLAVYTKVFADTFASDNVRIERRASRLD